MGHTRDLVQVCSSTDERLGNVLRGLDLAGSGHFEAASLASTDDVTRVVEEP